LERQFTKKSILEYYLNAAYFGHNVYGIELAALTFCRKPCTMLDDDDAAYLVGLLKAPARYCRCCKPEAAKRRTSLALRLAGGARSVDHTRYSSQARRLRSSYANRLPLTGGYVTQYARSWLKQNLRPYYPSRRLIAETTIDPRCQIVLETVCAGVRRLGYRGRLARVVQDARSGAIRALAGGVDFRLQEFNSATDGFLQPGSLLKPFILLAALQKGVGLDYRYESRPFTFKSGNGRVWVVRNAGERYFGWTTVADALVFSDNSVYVQLLLDVGVDYVRQLLASVGVPLQVATPTIGVGAIRPGVSPLQICTAYTIFSCGGTFRPSTIMRGVVEEGREHVWQEDSREADVSDPATIAVVNRVLRRVNSEGTGILPIPCTGLAAKTGTSISGGWHVSFDEVYRILTWTESDFLPVSTRRYPSKGVSAKLLAGRIRVLLKHSALVFSQLYGVFGRLESMSVKDLLWVEEEFQSS
jgi:penicillin-binding protein 1A